MDEVHRPCNLSLALPYYQNSGYSGGRGGGKDGQGREHREQSKPHFSMPVWSELGRGEAVNSDPIELVNTLKFNTSWKQGSLRMGEVTWLSTFKQISTTKVLSLG